MKPVYIRLAPAGRAYSVAGALRLARCYVDVQARALLDTGRYVLRAHDDGARFTVRLERV
jgi:hypothetical protein